MKKLLPVLVIVAVLLVGGSFYGGYAFAKSQKPAIGQGAFANANFRGGAMNRGAGAGQAAGGFTTGDIIAKDDKSVTVKLRDGGSKIIFYSTTTEIQKSATGTSADLTVGENVSVTGAANADGSITAKTIQLRPAVPAATK
jgi:hypothetical protein